MARTRSSGETGLGGVGTRCRSPIILPASSSNAALIPVPPISIASVRVWFIARLSLRTQRDHGVRRSGLSVSNCGWTCIRVKLISAVRQASVAEWDANWGDPEDDIGARRPGGAALVGGRAGGRPAGAGRSRQARPRRGNRVDRGGDDSVGRSSPRRPARLAYLPAEPRRFRLADGARLEAAPRGFGGAHPLPRARPRCAKLQ